MANSVWLANVDKLNSLSMKNFRDLKVWQKAHQLVLRIYQTTKLFPREEVYHLTNQLRRASASVPTNLAEGCGRSTQKDFAHYIQNAFGSAQEVEYLILLSHELGYLSVQEHTTLDRDLNEVKAMLHGLLVKVRKNSARA
jgi:four helix bundle protein